MGTKRDPFNFDDIYRQAGVEDLFVKKSLAEMKKTVVPTPVTVRLDSNKAAANRTPMNGSIPAVGSQHSSPRMVNIPDARPVQTSGPGLVADPFASLGLTQLNLSSTSSSNKSSNSQPKTSLNAAMSSPRQAPKPQSNVDLGFLGTPAQANVNPSVQTHQVLEFEDIFGTSTLAPASKTAAPVDPFALFEAIPGASAPVTRPVTDSTESLVLSPVPAAPVRQNHRISPTAIRQGSDANVATSAQHMELSQPSRLLASNSATSLKSSSAASSPRTSGGNHITFGASDPPPPPPPSYDQSFTAPSLSFSDQQHVGSRSSSHHSSQGDALQAQSSHTSQSGRNTGSLGGVLKMLGKTSKTVFKAAKDGLAQLNDALERFDNVDRLGPPRVFRFDSKDDDDADIPAEKALSYAIEISEMSPQQREAVMGQLPLNIRTKVAEILREQALAEAEAPVHDENYQQAYRTTSSPASRQNVAPPEPEVVMTHEFRLDDDPPAASYSPRQQRSTSSHASPRATPRATPPDEDLLGISAPSAARASSAPSPAPAVVAQDDLLGFDTAPVTAAPARSAPPPAAVHVNDVDSVADFFGGGTPVAPPRPTVRHTATPSSDSLDAFFSGGEKPAAPSQPARPAAARPAATARPAAAPQARVQPVYQDRVGGVLEDHGPARQVPTGPYFQDHDDDPDEPEIRKQLRAQRLAEKERKMQAALEEKLEKEQQEAAHRELQVQLKEKYKEDIMSWKNKNKDNVRGLLGSLQTVLWENSGWKPMGMAELLEPQQVRKAWMKANLIVHPDKVRQRNGTADQIAIADMVFDVLKEAWGKFQK